MKVRRIDSTLTIAAIVLTAVIAACSTTSNATGPTSPGSARQGDSVNLSGTYDLTSFPGGPTIDAQDGATIVLGKSTYNLQATGTFNGQIGPDSGTYVAIDTSSTAGVVAGTIALVSSVAGNNTTSAAFVISSDSLMVNVPNHGTVQNTVWIKQ